MTLIITLISKNNVIQASDRRISSPLTDGSAFPLSDNHNKMVYVRCADAHFVFSYTGQARVIDAVSAKAISTAMFAAQTLFNEKAYDLKFDEIATCFRHKIMPHYEARVPGVAFIFAGFSCGGDPFHYYFRTKDIEPKAIVDSATGFLSIAGATGAVSSFLEQRLSRVITRREFKIDDGRRLAKKLVGVIRMASKDKKYGSYIGPDCTTVRLKPNRRMIFPLYHSDKPTVRSYTPLIVSCIGPPFSLQLQGGLGAAHFGDGLEFIPKNEMSRYIKSPPSPPSESSS